MDVVWSPCRTVHSPHWTEIFLFRFLNKSSSNDIYSCSFLSASLCLDILVWPAVTTDKLDYGRKIFLFWLSNLQFLKTLVVADTDVQGQWVLYTNHSSVKRNHLLNRKAFRSSFTCLDFSIIFLTAGYRFWPLTRTGCTNSDFTFFPFESFDYTYTDCSLLWGTGTVWLIVDGMSAGCTADPAVQ